MTIGKKISFACTVLVGFTIAVGAVATRNNLALKGDLDYFVHASVEGLQSVLAIRQQLNDQRAAMLEHILARTPEEKRAIDAGILDADAKLQAVLAGYERTISTAEGRRYFDRVAPAHAKFRSVWEKIAPLSRENRQEEAMAIWNGEQNPAVAEMRKAVQDLADFRTKMTGIRADRATAANAAATRWCLAVLAISAVAGGILAVFIVRGVNRALAGAIAELSQGAARIANASDQVSVSSQTLAQGASEQGASLEETAAASEQVAATTRQNAENSRQAASLMKAVGTAVSGANGNLSRMVASMREITSSAGRISKIIQVIDGIAFQTNILALNAAVEAARAGEAGVGFAVVAEEVRHLARNSAQAARDTAAMIEDSIRKSEEGSAQLDEVGASIHSITENAEKAMRLVDEVEASSHEQARGIEQISQAVHRIDTVTQRSAANAEENAAASREMASESHALMTVVGKLQSLAGFRPIA